MRIASKIAQYLAGTIFLVFGLNGFLNFIHMPPPTGVAAQFLGALYVSHFYVVIFGAQVLGGLLLLTNRFVPLGLTVLAPVLVNILTFHITMAPAGLPFALFVTVLWFLVFAGVRSAFAPLFQSRWQPAAGAANVQNG